jgi:hypothetical protein
MSADSVVLPEISKWFIFDLKDAKALLDELSA